MTDQQDSRRNTITFEDAQILFRNFSGKESTYNLPGRRNFCVLLPHDVAGRLDADGWNVKMLKPRDEDEEPQPYMQVSVSYKYRDRAPKITIISDVTHKQTLLTEDTVHILDWADIKLVDFIVSPHFWNNNGKSGIKAYLKKMYVTIREDELERKYASMSPETSLAEDEYEDEYD